MSIITPMPPLHKRLRALAKCGHDHAVALEKAADELEIALASLDGAFSGVTLRDALRAQHRARLAWFRATGEQLSKCD